MSAPLLVGLLLAVTALAYVLYPLARARRGAASTPPRPDAEATPTRDVTDEEIEAAVRAYRASRSSGQVCAVCGPRTEPDAVYCSSCGRKLGASS